MIPRDAPVAANIDFELLAERFVMSGGHIRNAVLPSAFLAADSARPVITQSLLERAARAEAVSIELIVGL